LSGDRSHPQLVALLAQEIRDSSHQRISFMRYMEQVLYEPNYGYYATNAVNIGQDGDFFTSPHLGQDFGQLLAEQFVEMWQIMGRPNPFTLVEMGAGQGIIAQDILTAIQILYPEFFTALDYVIVERASALITEQQQRLAQWVKNWGNLKWSTLEELQTDAIAGCFFSNELIDAFPVHRFAIQQGQLQEIYVQLKPDSPAEFIETLAEPSTPKLVDYFDDLRLENFPKAYPDGYQSEVNLAALDWIHGVSDRLQQGYVLTIDYGYPATKYYNPARSSGTLQCYYQHRSHSNPYLHIGHQDLTAHVNFTALERQGERRGLETLGFTQQGLFLMALGLGDRLLANNNGQMTQDLSAIIRRREALHSLMNPMGLGGFGVLIQSKGLTLAERQFPLKGLKFNSKEPISG
jgi:SAM-dependent MidA family methyltransferase